MKLYDENGEEFDVDADELEYDPYYDDPTSGTEEDRW